MDGREWLLLGLFLFVPSSDTGCVWFCTTPHCRGNLWSVMIGGLVIVVVTCLGPVSVV